MRLLAITCLFMSMLWAENLPNTGLQLGPKGYYGEGVTFGGVPIVGQWTMDAGFTVLFDSNGTVNNGGHKDCIYGVSEEGRGVIIECQNYYSLELYEIEEEGSAGCFITEYFYGSEISHTTSTLVCNPLSAPHFNILTSPSDNTRQTCFPAALVACFETVSYPKSALLCPQV